jgi:hypothetical protein
VLRFIVDRAAQELGLTAVRADQISDPGQITLQVIDHILGARAAVADVTDLNPNVFYELAIRHSAHLPVVIIAEKDCELPFDIAQMRTIFFQSTDLQSADQCRSDIVSHLKRALGGAIDSPIVATMDFRALSGGSAVERNIADIITTIEDIAKLQRQMMDRIDRVDTPSGSEANENAVVNLMKGWVSLRDLAINTEEIELARIVRDLLPPIRHLAREAQILIRRGVFDLSGIRSLLGDSGESIGN